MVTAPRRTCDPPDLLAVQPAPRPPLPLGDPLRVESVAAALGVSRSTIYRWIEEGTIRQVIRPRSGGAIRIPRAEALRLLSTAAE